MTRQTLVLAIVLLVSGGYSPGAHADSQRPPGWLSGFTKDGREYWYHPDNPRDVRMKDVPLTTASSAPNGQPATWALPPTPSAPRRCLPRRPVATGAVGPGRLNHCQGLSEEDGVAVPLMLVDSQVGCEAPSSPRGSGWYLGARARGSRYRADTHNRCANLPTS